MGASRFLLQVLLSAFLFVGGQREDLWAADAPVAEPPIIMTLEKSVELGIVNASNVRKGEKDVGLSGELLLQSYAQFLPDLNASAQTSYSSGSTLVTLNGANVLRARSQNGALDLNTTLNLFNGLSDYAGLKSALARKDASLQSLFWAKQQVALDITQTYLQLVLDQLLLEISRKNLAASQARLKLFQAQAQVGAASLADLYRQQAQTSSDELAASNYEARYRDDQVSLVRKLRVDPRKRYLFETPSLEIVKSPLASRSVDELVKQALEDRTDVRASSSRVDFTGWDVTRSRSGYFPKLNLSFDRFAAGKYLTEQIYGGNDVLPTSQQGLLPQLGNQVTYALTLNLSWSIFDRFVTRYQVAQSRTLWENAQIDYNESRLQVDADVRVAYSDYQIALQQIQTAETGMKAAQQAYDAIIGRYSVGQASFIDVLTSQVTWVQAQANEAQARVNLKLRESALRYAVGKLMP